MFKNSNPPSSLAPFATLFVLAAIALSSTEVIAKENCARCIEECSVSANGYPPDERPMRPPDDVHHDSAKTRVRFLDARSLDPAFGGRDLDDAILGYRSAAKLAPDNAEYRNYLAAALMRRGDYKEARYNLKKASLLKPGEAKYLVNLGYAHHKLGEEVRALAAFLRAVMFDPRNVKARLFAAHAFRTLDLREEAEEEYRRVLALDPRNTGAKKGLRTVTR